MEEKDADFDANYIEQLRSACRKNDLETVIGLVAADKISHEDFRRNMAPGLSEAAAHGNAEIVEYLCKKFSALIFEDVCIRHAVLVECTKPMAKLSIFRYFIEEFMITPAEIRRHQDELFSRACSNGAYEIVCHLCELLDITREDFIQMHTIRGNLTVFADACHSGNLELVAYLADRFFITMYDIAEYEYMSLLTACASGSEDTVRYLCEDIPVVCEKEYADPKNKDLLEYIFISNNTGIMRYIAKKFKITRSKLRKVLKSWKFWIFCAIEENMIKYLLEEIDEELRLTAKDAAMIRDNFTNNIRAESGEGKQITEYLDNFIKSAKKRTK